MVISAREALRSMEKAISGARREEDRITEMLRSAVDDAARLRQEKAEALKALARIRLEHIAADETLGRLDSAEQRALDALERHNLAVSEAAIGVEEARSDLAAAEEARNAAAVAAEAAVAAVDALVDETYARMIDDPAWAAQTEVLQAAEARAAAADEKAAQAEADREEKRKPYESDPLFMYLWQRGFGTQQYRAAPIVRYGDARVAQLIGYHAARPNYHMLMEIPRRLREHAGRLRDAADAELAKRERIERAALVASGIEPLEANADKADEALEAAEDRVEDLRQDMAAAADEHAKKADDRNDAQLQAALNALAEEMGRESLTQLYREALKTATTRDEEIVQRLRALEAKLERREAEAEEVRRTATELAARRTQLEQSRDHFRQSGFDDPRGQFANGDIIGTAIEAVVRGAMTSGALNRALRDGFSRRMPRAGGSFGGGLKSRRSSPMGRSRSSGSRSGGRSRGGGFRTGGGF